MSLLARLRRELGPDAVSQAADVRTSEHVSGRSAGEPIAWVRPSSTRCVETIVRASREHGVRIVPVGAATTFWGGLDVGGALALDTRALRSPPLVDRQTRYARVGAGITIRELDIAAREAGLVLASRPDSAGDTPMGSLFAVGSTSGLGMGHGLAIEQVTGATAVLGTGDVVRVGTSRFLHDRPGGAHGLPNALSLLASAQGRAGIVTELDVLLRPAPYVATFRAARVVRSLPALEALLELLSTARSALDARTLDTFRVELGREGARAEIRVEVMARSFSDRALQDAVRSATDLGAQLSLLGFSGRVEGEPPDARRGVGPAYEYHWSCPVDEHRKRLKSAAFWGIEATTGWGSTLVDCVRHAADLFETVAEVHPRHRRLAFYPGHHVVSVGVHVLAPRTTDTISRTIGRLEEAARDVLRVGVPYRTGVLWRDALDDLSSSPEREPTRAMMGSIFAALDPDGLIGSVTRAGARDGA